MNCPALVLESGLGSVIYTSDKEELSNGAQEYPIETFAQIDCLDGSRLTRGSSELFCTEDGQWDGPLGTCEADEEEATRSSEISSSPARTTTFIENENTSNFRSYSPTTTDEATTTTMRSPKPPSSDIPERFWVELRNYLFHGCQAYSYQSVLCKVTSRPLFSDLSLKPPKEPFSPADERNAMAVLGSVCADPQLPSLTIDSLYERLTRVTGKPLLPEDSFRQFLSFSIDSIVWNHSHLAEYLQANAGGVAELLVQIVRPVFIHFQLHFDYEHLFSAIATPTSTEEDRDPETTTLTQRPCPLSELPPLPNGVHEVVDGGVVYRCLDTFTMDGDGFVVGCAENGSWAVVSRGRCRRSCGVLQMPESMRPQGECR